MLKQTNMSAVMALVLMLFCTLAAAAQQRVMLLWEMGYQYGVHPDGDKIIGVPDLPYLRMPGPDHTYDHTAWLGLVFVLPLSKSIDLETRIAGEYAMSFAGGRLTQPLPVLAQDSAQAAANQVIQYDSRARSQTLWLDGMVRFPLLGQLHLESGLRLNCRLGAWYSQHIRLVSPADAMFAEGGREQMVREETSFNVSPFFIGPMAGLAYDIPFMTAVILRPGIRFRMDIGSADDGTVWNRPALALIMGIYPGKDFAPGAAAPPDTE